MDDFNDVFTKFLDIEHGRSVAVCGGSELSDLRKNNVNLRSEN